MLLLIKDKSGRYLVNQFQIHSIQEAYRQKTVSSDIFCRGLTLHIGRIKEEKYIYFLNQEDKIIITFKKVTEEDVIKARAGYYFCLPLSWRKERTLVNKANGCQDSSLSLA